MYFVAKSENDREEWIEALTIGIHYYNYFDWIHF